MRLKQYIMDSFEFNLDLTTWGLTRQDRELARFARFISPEEIARSNALFGYHGDKYYFDVDIRRHFGLDKYEGDIIPYWKTETVEAMSAFNRKEGYRTGAGECVSLSTLYAAAAFIVCGIPLEDIYLVLTPLHSQNFIDLDDGVLTNNRRILTKSMWFNGTALSEKAQRALRHEQVTVVAHPTGCVHCMYPDATIPPVVYETFKNRLNRYLTTELTSLTLANFLRATPKYQRYFQFCQQRRGESMFIWAEVLFHYEHGSNFRIADQTFDKLLDEVLSEDYSLHKAPNRLCCEELMAFIRYEDINLMKNEDRARMGAYIKAFVPEAEAFVRDLHSFHHLEPRLPGGEKRFLQSTPIQLSANQGRREIIDTLHRMRPDCPTADLAFYAFRDMDTCDWEPFIVAALERSPVSIEAAKRLSIPETYEMLIRMDGESIYDGNRLAQPDEVANFNTGDGVEKALFLANVLRGRISDLPMRLDIEMHDVLLRADREYRFSSDKHFNKSIAL